MEPIKWVLGDTWRISFSTADVDGTDVTATAVDFCLKRIGGTAQLILDLADTEVTATLGSIDVVILPAVTGTLDAGRYTLDLRYVANGHTESLQAPLSVTIRAFCEV